MNARDAMAPYQLVGRECRAGTALQINGCDAETTCDICSMHRVELVSSEGKAFKFLCAWLDGPELWHQIFGHPHFTMRHFPSVHGKGTKGCFALYKALKG